MPARLRPRLRHSSHDRVRTDRLARPQASSTGSHCLRQPIERGLVHELSRRRVSVGERERLRAQRFIGTTGTGDEVRARVAVS